MNSVDIVEQFWDRVWKARQPEAIGDFVVDDVVLTNAGVDIRGKGNFIAWARDFLGKIDDFHFEVIETFQNRVASLWRVIGRNNGMLGTNANQKPVSFTGTAVWNVREDGKLLQNRAERAVWEAYQQIA